MKLLDGIQVLNLALNLPGPAATRCLHRMGASVIKVEPPEGDPMERCHAEWYKDLTKGQQRIRLDLKSGKGHARFNKLLHQSDLLISAGKPAALERMGLGWEILHHDFPRLCQVAIVGYPAPRENETGHDLTWQAALGLLNPPHLPRTLLADMAGAKQAVATAMALLLARERGQGGAYAQVALSEAAAFMAEPLQYESTVPGALLGGGVPEYNIYLTRNGWIAVAALEPRFKKRLTMELGNGVRKIEQFQAIFKTKTAAEWQTWGEKLDIPIIALKDAVKD